MPTIHTSFLTPHNDELVGFASSLEYRPVPPWLGDFDFVIFGFAYGRHHGRLPPSVKAIATLMERLAPPQLFTTCFIQRYRVGEKVLSHRDPKNNLHNTVVGVFGCFTGARSIHDGNPYQLLSGDVAVQPCTVDGVQGARHSVEPVLSGERFALILNTLK